jgi:hypothetical protein
MIVFDLTLTSKDDISECFRVFTNPDKMAAIPAHRFIDNGTRERHPVTQVYTDDACMNNGKPDARCGAGVWFGPDDPRNLAPRVPGENSPIKLEK